MKVHVINGVTIREDMTEWVEKLKKVPEKKLKPIVKKYAFKIAADTQASPLMPVDTGTLKNSINAKEETPLSWIVQDGVEYGIYQELGTSKGVPARHFLGNACERNAEDFFEELKDAIIP